MDAVVRTPAYKMRDSTAGNEGFGRSATVIDASSSDVGGFDKGDGFGGFGVGYWERLGR